MTDQSETTLEARVGELEGRLILAERERSNLAVSVNGMEPVVDAARLLVEAMYAEEVDDPQSGGWGFDPSSPVSEGLQRLAHLIDPGRYRAVKGEEDAPENLAEWYDQLVDAAARGNAPEFAQESERIVELAREWEAAS